jgi:FkbM family methyltransferase
MPDAYKQLLVQNVESVVPNSQAVILNNVSSEHAGWFTFAEIETKHFLTKSLKKDSICFDVGANIGLYSLFFLQQSSDSKVFAFEPSSNFRFLEQNIPEFLKNRFQAFNLGLGDVDGVSENEIWESFGHKKVKVSVNFSTLDTFLKHNPVERIDFLKIDTDGFETQILRGAGETLLKYRPLIIIESDGSSEGGQSFVEIDLTLNRLGYLHLGTLDGSNEIYADRSDSRLSEFKKFIRRSFRIKKTFLGELNSSSSETLTHVLVRNLKFTSTDTSRTFFQKAFYTTGVPWNYIASSPNIDSGAKFLQISGLILGADSNLICISDTVPTVFSLPLPSGLYENILIPLKNMGDASNIRMVIRSAGTTSRSLIFGLNINLLT